MNAINSLYFRKSEDISNLVRRYPKLLAFLNDDGFSFLKDCFQPESYRNALVNSESFSTDVYLPAIAAIEMLNIISEFGVNKINETLSYDEIKAVLDKRIHRCVEEPELRFRVDGKLFSFNEKEKLKIL